MSEAGDVHHAARVRRDSLLATVGVTAGLAFLGGGGFLVYAGNHDEQRPDFSAEEHDAAGIEVEAGIAFVMLGVAALAFGGHYLEALHDDRVRAQAVQP